LEVKVTEGPLVLQVKPVQQDLKVISEIPAVQVLLVPQVFQVSVASLDSRVIQVIKVLRDSLELQDSLEQQV